MSQPAIAAISEVASLCAASGWPFTEGETGCRVKLEVRREAVFHAHVECAAGGILAWVDLTGAVALDVAPPQECHQAARALLRELEERMKLVRGALGGTAAEPSARLEVCLALPCTVEQLADALSALSVACELAGPEIQLLLSNPEIACLTQTNCAGGRSPQRQDALPVTLLPGGEPSAL